MDNTMCSDHTLTFQHKGEKVTNKLPTMSKSNHNVDHGLGEYREFLKEEDQPVITEITNNESDAEKEDN